MDDKEYLSRLEGEKKTESVLVRGQPLPILSTPGPTLGLFEDCQKKMIFVIFKSFAFTARLDSLYMFIKFQAHEEICNANNSCSVWANIIVIKLPISLKVDC